MKKLLYLCLMLASCVSVPQKDLAQLGTPLSLDSIVEEALTGEDFQEGQWPNGEWWELFGDPGLTLLVQQGLKDNPSLKKAAARVRQAEQQAKEKRASLFPEVEGIYEENWEHLSKNGLFRFAAPTFPSVVNLVDIALSFKYEFDFWEKNGNLFKAALGRAHTKIAEQAQAQLIITTTICKAYFDIQANRKKLHILKEMGVQKQAFLELTRSRSFNGLDNTIDTLSAERDLYATQQGVLQLEGAVAVSEHLLNALIATSPEVTTHVEERPETLSSFPLPGNVGIDLLARRPDLMAQIWRVEAAAHEINAAKANFYPNINLTALLGFESVSFHKLFMGQNNATSLSPAIHLPIFTAGKLKAQLAEKVALFDEAVYEYNHLLLKAAEEVADQLVLLGKVGEELRIQNMVLASMRQTYAIKFLRYTQGVANYLTVIKAEERLLSQRLTTVDLTHRQLLETVFLIKALGGGYE